MKLLKPCWVTHDEKPIFSVDIHPAGNRFATGGQGRDSGRVVVWNLNSVLDESVELDANVPKMLCQMDNHLACVNCVRWSNDGRYLASGGDDRLVMVWALSGATGSTVFGSNGKLNVETWRLVFTLRGHAGDILDLAWSPLDKWVASCSVDNTIIVWNAQKLPEMVCVLNGHTGLVKGVTWDPVGRYLASQSDDKSLRIWKTVDWTSESVITEPFEECSGTTHVLRLSWSPDGQYVVSAHAMNGGGPTAQIVDRDGWRYDKDFVGHRKAVTCARFNNNILVKDGKRYCCVAMGSRDRSLSIWLTSLKRPLVVVHDLFTDSVLDLSWSSDGLTLVACSWDGTVACIQFTNKEVGVPLTLTEKNALYERTYGKCVASELAADEANSSLLVECPEILVARERGTGGELPPKAGELPPKPGDTGKEQSPPAKTIQGPGAQTPPPVALAASAGAGATTPVRPVDRQIETRTSDGKRRITPVFIPLTPASHNESGNSVEGCFSSSSASKSRIVVEVRADIVTQPNVSNHAAPAHTPAPAPHQPTSFANLTHAPAPAPTPTPQPAQAAAAAATATRDQDTALDSRLRKRDASGALPGPRSEDLAAKCARADPAPARAGPAGGGAGAASSGAGTAVASARQLPASAPSTNPIVRCAGKHRLQIVNNAVNTPYGKLCRLQLLAGGAGAAAAAAEPLWETYLGSSVVSVVCDARHVCVGCEDGTLHCWATGSGSGSSSGGGGGRSGIVERALPPLALGSRPLRLALSGARLAAVTAAAKLLVWDLAAQACLVRATPIHHLLHAGVAVSNCTLLESGDPLVQLSNGKSYVYSRQLATWVVWMDAADPIWRNARGVAAARQLPTPHAGAAPAAAVSPDAATHARGGVGAGATSSWLEGQTAACKHLRLQHDYTYWLLALVHHLALHGTERDLRGILDEMLGPSHCTSSKSRWSPQVLGVKKHDLLEQMLSIIVKQLKWQRLYIEYADQLSALKLMASKLNGYGLNDPILSATSDKITTNEKSSAPIEKRAELTATDPSEEKVVENHKIVAENHNTDAENEKTGAKSPEMATENHKMADNENDRMEVEIG